MYKEERATQLWTVVPGQLTERQLAVMGFKGINSEHLAKKRAAELGRGHTTMELITKEEAPDGDTVSSKRWCVVFEEGQ